MLSYPLPDTPMYTPHQLPGLTTFDLLAIYGHGRCQVAIAFGLYLKYIQNDIMEKDHNVY